MKKIFLGIDIGSTTVKIICLNESSEIIYSDYRRHFSDIKHIFGVILKDMFSNFKNIINENLKIGITITGSAGIGISKILEVNFSQEVISCVQAIEKIIPQTDVAIELGGEDAKITFLKNGTDQRMNGSCAGGTGSFIDQMAILLNTDAMGLNELAKKYKMIYPIASRCGVFAKTDIQPLINEGVNKEDIAASIFQAVVNQTISGLACGRKIEKKVAFLGGPLYFLSELRKRFTETLKVSKENIIFPDNSQLFVAKGACFIAQENKQFITYDELMGKIDKLNKSNNEDKNHLRPLFLNSKEKKEFYIRHNKNKIKNINIDNYEGNAYLGIDAGSTTLKLVLLSEKYEILYSSYSSNKGSPLKILLKEMENIYNKIENRIKISSTCVTGYGEQLIKSAFNIDFNIVETIAHYKGAKYFLNDVDFILDIGGQDMKCLKIENGNISSILLNEACSSGCGSFLETFAKSLNIKIEDFAEKGLNSKMPCDLGTRCTVFMNSKVKQSQKDGAKIEDISAGLSYSVVKNTLFKVIKIKNSDELGKNIVVQGGTFLNDCVLRAFELVSGKEVIRPNIAGLLGAFGCAIIAKEKALKSSINESLILNLNEIKHFSYKTNFTRCKGCGNNCQLTIHTFENGKRFISGNRCDKFFKKNKRIEYNMVEYEYERLFNYKALEKNKAFRGEIGIPRVLNYYDSYPFWFTLLTKLGFRVIISDDSSKKIFNKGIDTISSDSICYPAKMVHGHIANLIEKGLKKIFYPSVVYEQKEYKEVDNNFNCPIVISYSEVIKNNMDILKENDIEFINPFISLEDKQTIYRVLKKEFLRFGISSKEIKEAIDAGWVEKENYKKDLVIKAKEILNYIKKNNKTGIVICGRPYHLDKEINHKIPEIINSYDMPIVTGSAISAMCEMTEKLRIVDQWTFHSRLFRVASFVGKIKNLELIELNSFGCGLDAIVLDQVSEILQKYGKMHTVLKIDEINNTSAAKIRIRSLLAVIDERKKKTFVKPKKIFNNNFSNFTEEERREHTIIAPQMSPVHFELISSAFSSAGYNLEILKESKEAIDIGLKYVNNDACYPAILTIGELILALKSGKYDLNRTSVLISQTGGSCRATNYIGLLKKALNDSGYEKIPIISLNGLGYEKQAGFNINLFLLHKLLMAISYGDLLLNLLYQTRPYELLKNETNRIYSECKEIAKENIAKGNIVKFKKNIYKIIDKFASIEIKKQEKVKVGIVGEILVKFSPCANNQIVDLLEKEGCEVKVFGLMNFLNYCLYSEKFLEKKFNGKVLLIKQRFLMNFIRFYTNMLNNALDKSKIFKKEKSIEEIAKLASKYISIGNQSGEGWFLTGEIIDFIMGKIENIVCIQPFGCLPNQLTGKGMMKKIKYEFPKSNIIAIDYDPSYSEVNQLNRIKLMVSVGKKQLGLK